MIQAVYDRENLRVAVKGHANSGEKGHDLVCAAASILVYTLAGQVAQMSTDKQRVRRPVIDLNDGSATVACCPVHGNRAVVTLVYDSICAGFDILQQRYPENIKYSVVG